MKVIFVNSFDEEISQQQALVSSDYGIRYLEGNVIQKEERYLKGELRDLRFYNVSRESHEAIWNAEYISGLGFSIVEVEYFGDYRLEKTYSYDENFFHYGFDNVLYDPNDIKICSEAGKGGVADYNLTMKEYFDPKIYDDGPVFICFFDDRDGSFESIEFPNEEICNLGQEREVFFNTPADIEIIRGRTGISKELMDYYLSPNVIPNGNLS